MVGLLYRKPFAAGVVGSIAVHAIVFFALWSADAAPAPAHPSLITMETVDVDLVHPVTVLPPVAEPPVAEPPVAEPPKPEPKPEPEPQPQRIAEPEPVPEPEPAPDLPADPEPIPDPNAVAALEATAPPATAPAESAESASKSEPPPPRAMSNQQIALDLAALTEQPSLEGILDSEPVPGVAADLNAAMPGAPVVTVLLRLDRLRDTMWAERAEAIVAPMPDYRAIVTGEHGSFFDVFDTLIISSPRPNDVTATLVAGHVRGADSASAADARAFLGGDGAVTWSDSEHGLRGIRAPATLPHPRDTRLFFVRANRWVLLARPEYFGADPAWLDALDPTEQLSGTDDGPIAVVSARGFPDAFLVPTIGEVPGPERITAVMVNAGRGFYVRGTLVFSDEERAETFADALATAKRSAVAGIAAKSLLEGFGAYNAAKGLIFRREGTAVSFATSVSILDARALMDLAAEWTAKFYEAMARPAPAAPRTPARKSPPGPGKSPVEGTKPAPRALDTK